jgi:hypothetical protein
MKSSTLGIITVATLGLLLGACSSSPLTSSTPGSSAAPSVTGMEKGKGGMKPMKGGQAVESGKYHLELVPEKEASATHLDLYVMKGDTHDVIPDAKVTAEVQLPGGKQESVLLNYDASGKHYAGKLASKASGQYQVKVTAMIGADKADGRFSFNR